MTISLLWRFFLIWHAVESVQAAQEIENTAGNSALLFLSN